MKRLFMPLGLLIIGCLPLAAQDSKVEVFGGYSYLRFSEPSGAVDLFNLKATNNSGWNAAATYNVNRHFGATADFSGHYGEIIPGISRFHTFLFGPKVTFCVGRASVFAHAMGGAVHGSRSALLGTESSGAFAFGGGVDWKVKSRLSLRIGQFDYLGTRLFGDTENSFRFSTGLVFHF